MYLTHNKGKSVIIFIRTLESTICKYMISISKHVYIVKLDDVVKKYNNTYHRTTKMKPVDVKPSAYIGSSKEIIDAKYLELFEYQNIKAFLQKAMFQIALRKFLWLKKLKILCRGHILFVIVKAKKLLERFTKKIYQKTNKKEFKVKKSNKSRFKNATGVDISKFAKTIIHKIFESKSSFHMK